MYGIAILVNYSTISHCFFNSCNSDRAVFISKFFGDVKIKALFGINVGFLIILKYLFLRSARVFDLLDETTRITPGDYTALVGKIGKTQTAEELIAFFEVKVSDVKVAKVNFIYDIKDFYKIVQEWMRLERKINMLEVKDLRNTTQYQTFVKERHRIKESFYELKANFTNPKTFKDHFTGYAFVTFTGQDDMRKVVKSLNFNMMSFQISKTRYSVRRAHEPVDIVWENFGLTFWQKQLRRVLSIIVSLIIVGMSFGIMILLKMFQNNFDVSSDGVTVFYAISVLISFFVIIMNFILRKVLRFFTQIERRTTYTALDSEVVFKVGIAYFVNTGIVVLVANLFVLKNTDIWGPEGVISNIITIQIISILSDSLFYIASPYYIIKRVKQYLLNSEIAKSKNNNKILQYELNKAYEGMNFDIAERYYLVFKTTSVAFFFQTVMPYLLLFAAAEFFIVYWTQKYYLTKRCVRPRDIDFKLSEKMVKMFEMMIFIMTLGYLTFERLTAKETSVFTIVIVCIGGFEWLVVEVSMIAALCSKKYKLDKIPYSEASKVFPNDYDRMNPVTQKEAMVEWLSDIGAKKASMTLMGKSSKYLNESPNEGHLVENLFNLVQNNQHLGLDHKSMVRDIPLHSELRSHFQRNEKDDPLNALNIYRIGFEAQNTQKQLIYEQNKNNLHKSNIKNSIITTPHITPNEKTQLDMFFPIDLFKDHPITTEADPLKPDSNEPSIKNLNGQTPNVDMNQRQPGFLPRINDVKKFSKKSNEIIFDDEPLVYPNPNHNIGTDNGIFFTPALYDTKPEDAPKDEPLRPDLNYFDAFLNNPAFMNKRNEPKK